MMPRLEDFQAGIPLNEDLRRLKAGILDEPAAQEEAAEALPFDHPERPLTEDERTDLARLVREPGWRVLERLRKRTLLQLRETAILASEINPLANAEKIAAGWANFSAYKQMAALDAGTVHAEIAKLKQEAK